MDANLVLIAVAVLLAVLLLVVVVVLARLGGRLAQLSTGQATAQAQLTRTLEERLDAVTKRLGDSLSEQTEKTGRNLTDLQKRLAVIDSAQKNITELSSQVVGLQDILSNKQARGAFGEIQLRDLVADALPPRAYEWQATLSNRKRVDCLVKLPTPPGPIAIDSKFPLEGYRALREAPDEAAALLAGRKFSDDVRKHVRDIQERYIIPGETADWAILFLPSEAVYAEIHANFPNVVEDAHRRHVAIVSPTTLMATLNTVRAILKDTQMREQAGFIQTEVEKMLDDVGRLDKRVGELQQRFHKAEESIREIRTSTDKITGRGGKIVDAELGDETPAEDLPPPRERIERSG